MEKMRQLANRQVLDLAWGMTVEAQYEKEIKEQEAKVKLREQGNIERAIGEARELMMWCSCSCCVSLLMFTRFVCCACCLQRKNRTEVFPLAHCVQQHSTQLHDLHIH
jgi:hypothetical protein